MGSAGQQTAAAAFFARRNNLPTKAASMTNVHRMVDAEEPRRQETVGKVTESSV